MKKSEEQGTFAPEGQEEHISAADYDPSDDRREDEEKRLRAVVEKDEGHQESDVEEVEEVDDVDDMFALDVTERQPKTVKKKIAVSIWSLAIISDIETFIRNQTSLLSSQQRWIQPPTRKGIIGLFWVSN